MRILGGVHTGAETTLENETITVGSAEQCDIVIEDDAIAHQAFEIEAGATLHLTVLDPEGEVRIGGATVEGQLEIQPFDVITINALALAVGPADSEWPEIASPQARKAPEQDQPAPTANAQERKATREDTAQDTKAQRRSRRKQTWITMGIAASILIAGTAAAMFAVSGAGIIDLMRSAEQEQTIIEEVVKAQGGTILKNDETRRTQTTEIVVVTQRQKNAMLEALAREKIIRNVHIRAGEEIAQTAQLVLDRTANATHRNALQAQADQDVPGAIKIMGYVENDEDLVSTRELIKREVHEAVRVRYDTQTRAQRIETLRERLDKIEGAQGLQIQSLGKDIGLIGGIAGDETLKAVQIVANNFNAEFSKRPRVVLKGSSNFLGQSTLDLDVRAVILGDRIHVILNDGKKYAEGARVKKHYLVKKIEDRYMILERAADISGKTAEGMPQTAYVVFGE